MGGSIRKYNVVEYLYGDSEKIHYKFLNKFYLTYKRSVSKAKKGHGLKRDHSRDKIETWMWLPEIGVANSIQEFFLDDIGSSCVIETPVGEFITTDKVDSVLTNWMKEEETQKNLIRKLVFENDLLINMHI